MTNTNRYSTKFSQLHIGLEIVLFFKCILSIAVKKIKNKCYYDVPFCRGWLPVCVCVCVYNI